MEYKLNKYALNIFLKKVPIILVATERLLYLTSFQAKGKFL